MNLKRIILICGVITIFATLGVASAGLFDFGQEDVGLIPTKLTCSPLMGNDTIEFNIYYNDSDSGVQKLGDEIVYYNITDENGNILSSGEQYSSSVVSTNRVELPKHDGLYIVNAYFPGNEEYAPSEGHASISLDVDETGVHAEIVMVRVDAKTGAVLGPA
ncbi:hypothetical protein [Methanobrevibacter sp.]|uniref:hypothetical protein n=1 Tax=Methanobrevibacter sp. TaxID=66852 RepID=UPI00388F4DF9